MTARTVVLGAGVAGLTTAIALARGGATVDVLERDRMHAPFGRRSAATWVRDGVPQVQHAHVFGAGFHRLLASELPDALAMLLEAGAQEISAPGREPALALRRPLLDWVLRRVAEREPGVRVHCGNPATGLRTDGSRLTGVLVRGGVLDAEVAVDATGSRTRTASWLADLGYSCAHPPLPDPPPTTTYYSRCYSLRWPEEPRVGDFAGAQGGGFDGYLCHAVPGDNETFTVTFGVPESARESAREWTQEPASVLSALRTPEGFQAAAEHVPVISDWVDRCVADPLSAVAVLRDWPPAGDRGLPDLAVLPGLVAVGDARGVPDPTAGDGVTMAMAHGLACASAILDSGADPRAGLERAVAAVGAASIGSGPTTSGRIGSGPVGSGRAGSGPAASRPRPLNGPNARELTRIADSVSRSARVSA